MRIFLFALPVLAIVGMSARADDFLKDENWEGLKEYWKIEGNTIVGTTPAAGLKFNTFLCSKKKYKDFELKFEVRLKDGKGNSGVQIRSKIAKAETFAVAGPQCDIGEGYWGSLYGELFGGMMKQADAKAVNEKLKKDDFNEYHIRCSKKHVLIKVNGVVTVDEDFDKMPEEGIIAFQLHAGASMEVTFKNILFRTSSEDK